MLTLVKDKQTVGVFDLVGDENMHSLGLGRLMTKLSSTKEREGRIDETRNEMMVSVDRTIEEENIDPTLFFFSLDTDECIVSIDELTDITTDRINEFIIRARERLNKPFLIQMRRE
jgi:hypothetical protein